MIFYSAGRLQSTNIDLSKILVGQTKILGGKVVRSDKCTGVSQLWGKVSGLPLSLRLC